MGVGDVSPERLSHARQSRTRIATEAETFEDGDYRHPTKTARSALGAAFACPSGYAIPALRAKKTRTAAATLAISRIQPLNGSRSLWRIAIAR
jgi:hypothetical protein